MRIAGEDRDKVFLLFSDLRDYIQNEVATARGVSRDQVRVVSLLLMMLCLVGFFATIRFASVARSPDATKAVASADVVTKLNFLINDERQRDLGGNAWIWLVAMVLITLGITGDFIPRLLRYGFPANEFLFGKRKEAFERRKRLMNNVLWGVIVAFSVSVLAGLIVWWITRKT